MPVGFTLDESSSIETNEMLFRAYSKADGEKSEGYTIDCCLIQEGGQISTYDNEHTVWGKIDINGCAADLGISEDTNGETAYYLFWERNGIYCNILATMPLNELIKVAEGIY